MKLLLAALRGTTFDIAQVLGLREPMIRQMRIGMPIRVLTIEHVDLGSVIYYLVCLKVLHELVS